MSGDTWVAIDTEDPDSFAGECCWVSDVGEYVGPVPVPELDDTSFVPEDANRVEYLIVPPNPDGRDDHVIGTGSPYRGTADWVKQKYMPPSTIQVFGDPSVFDSGSHLFVFWYPPEPTSTVGDLPTLVTLPLDLTPYGWVTGARMGAPTGGSDDPETGPSGGSPDDTEVVSFTLHDTDGSLIGTLANANGGSWRHELSFPGYLTCKVRDDDPLFSSLTPKRILKAWWRGGARMAARIDSSAVDLAVDGHRWREFNQLPGALSMTGDGIIYPEAPLVDVSASQRWFGYMSQTGAWYDSGDWSTPGAVAWADMTGAREGKPEGLDFPNPSWIALPDPTTAQDAGTVQFFRRSFTLSHDINYQILATADNNLTLWLDGQQLVTPDMQEQQTWRFLVQITGQLTAGTHLLAAKVTNGIKKRDTYTNPMGFLFTLQRLQSSGDVYEEPPIINSNASWKASDAAVGFRRGDVLATIFDEARARGVTAFTTLSRGFTHSADSNGDAWADDPGEHSLDVMTTVSDAVPVLTAESLDVDLDFDTMTLQAFNQKGTDLSGSVTINAATPDASAKVQRVERVEAKANTALVQKADGTYVEVADSASVTAYGRIEVGLQDGSTAETATAESVAEAVFAESADTAYTFTVTVSTVDGPQPYADFDLGDFITLVDDEGTDRKVRVLAIVVDKSSEQPEVTLEVTVDRS